MLISPRQNAFTEFRYLLSLFQHNGIFTDQIDARNMAVQVDTDARPVKARGNLFNVRGFASAMITCHHDAAIVGKARQNRHGGFFVEEIVRI